MFFEYFFVSFDLPHFTMLQRTKEPMTFHTTYPFISGQKRRIYQQYFGWLLKFDFPFSLIEKYLLRRRKKRLQRRHEKNNFKKSVFCIQFEFAHFLEEKFLQQVDLTEEKKDLEAINKKIEIEQKNIETLKQHIQSIKELSTKLNVCLVLP